MKIIVDYIIRIIQALSTAGIVCLLIYFFIYYRKSVKSLLDALGDVEKLKWGKHGEFIRRTQKQLEKIADVVHTESAREEVKPHVLNNSKDEMYKLKSENVKLKKLLLGTSTVAATTSSDFMGNDRIAFFENIRDLTYKDVSSSEPTSDLVELTSEFIGKSYKGPFLWIIKDGKEQGPYCIPCSTKGEFNQLIEIADGFWKCRKCNRRYDERDS